VLRAFKYRLYPTKNQVSSLFKQKSGHNFLYNQALAQRILSYQLAKISVKTYDQMAYLIPTIRNKSLNVQICNYSSLQQTLRKLDKSFAAFFRRVREGAKEAGFPRFKPSSRFHGWMYGSIGDGCQIKENRLYLQNIGCVRVRWHRLLEGKIKTVSISCKNDKWYASFYVEQEQSFLPKTGRDIGIDVGLENFISTTEGEQIASPKFFRKAQAELRVAKRSFSRKNKGSASCIKQRKIVAKKHEHIANQRADFHHKVARSLVDRFDGFAVERLNIKGMVQNKHLAKSISDAGWGNFLNILNDKAEKAGRWYQEVDPKWTSQFCSRCGGIVKKSLSVRIHHCTGCGLTLDRDVNAAHNILKKARMGPESVNQTVGPACS
jgi:putative transposase